MRQPGARSSCAPYRLAPAAERAASQATESPAAVYASGALQLWDSCPARFVAGLVHEDEASLYVPDFSYRPGQSRDQYARAATAEPCPRAAARAGSLSGGVILPPLAVDPCDSRPHNPAVLPDGVLRPWTGRLLTDSDGRQGDILDLSTAVSSPLLQLRVRLASLCDFPHFAGFTSLSTCSSAGTSGRRSGSRFDGARQHEGDGAIIEPLLKGHALVNGDQNLELADHRVGEPAVRQARPTEIDDACNVVAVDALGQPPRDAVVEQDGHCASLLTSLGGSFAGLCDGGLARHLQHGDRMLLGDVGKVLQELRRAGRRLRCCSWLTPPVRNVAQGHGVPTYTHIDVLPGPWLE